MFPNLGSKYIFQKELGQGGTGVVNLALDTHTGFMVAIKSLFTSHTKSSDIVKKFRIEANIYLMLNHPNIVQLKAPGLIIKEKQIHLVMEHVEGLTLDKYIKEITGPIPLEIALSLFKKIVDAIGFAHNKKIPIKGYDGILHLDIKPSNIFILPDGNVKVIDYGISQGNDEDRGDKVMGSLMFMAPEQLDTSIDLDNRTDIYSLGILLHIMVTGQNPYKFKKDSTIEDLVYKIHNVEPIRIQELYPGADNRFQFIIDKATQKDPFSRFQSCSELIEIVDSLMKTK